MPKTFFIADTHFGDDSIRRYENRPFADVAEMNTALTAAWNAAVSPEDTVYLLGDVSAQDEEADRALLAALHGHKRLVMGNHDRRRTPAQWRALGFEEVYDCPVIYQGFYILSHEPLYVCRNMPYANIFGHVHANPSYRDFSEQSVCVSVERIGYAPLEFTGLSQRLIKGSDAALALFVCRGGE